MQNIYIYMDDSGKLSTKETCSTFGGVIFLSKREKDKFITQYKSIINDIKCNYCDHVDKCDNNCLEIKNFMIKKKNKISGHNKIILLKPKDKRRIRNYIKQYTTFSCAIENLKVHDSILMDKPSKGRYLDYVQKIIIKEVVLGLINKKLINPFIPVNLVITIDEQTTKTNGYYNLYHSIKEEFLYGIRNYNYGYFHKPILYNDLRLNIYYVQSNLNYCVQAADFIAGETREVFKRYLKDRTINIDKQLNFIDYKRFFP